LRPVIGITVFNENKPKKMYSSISSNYVRSVYMAGGLPVLIPIMEDKEYTANYIDIIDGLVLTGGEDVLPILYGENPLKEVNSVDPQRDNHEYNLFLEAVAKDMPVLGICRGIQLMNIALGGTLYQDIYKQFDNAFGHNPGDVPVDSLHHSIKLEEKSILYDIFRKKELNVNSRHHQAVKDLGKNLRVTALSDDGIVEGIESMDNRFIVGVQWHPEDLVVKYPEFLGLFMALVNESYK
jgi:putative glutamine amidotransferase